MVSNAIFYLTLTTNNYFYPVTIFFENIFPYHTNKQDTSIVTYPIFPSNQDYYHDANNDQNYNTPNINPLTHHTPHVPHHQTRLLPITTPITYDHTIQHPSPIHPTPQSHILMSSTRTSKPLTYLLDFHCGMLKGTSFNLNTSHIDTPLYLISNFISYSNLFHHHKFF